MKRLVLSWLFVGAFTPPLLAQTPTWSKDVGPLLAKHCMNCHRPGEIAPMSLLSYETARPWARSIKNEVRARVMPPWPADPAFGRFSNDRRLSDADVATIVAWVDGGAPRGDGTFTAPTFADGWLLGEPDLIVEMEADYVVPAGGPDINTEIQVPIRNLPHDVWVRAVEVRGNPSVVHHNVVYSVDAEGNRDTTGRLASFTPGKQYRPVQRAGRQAGEAGLDAGLLDALPPQRRRDPRPLEGRLVPGDPPHQLPDPLAGRRRPAARDPARRSELRECRRVHVPHRR